MMALVDRNRQARSSQKMIVLFTDFGIADPYVGQLHTVFARQAPGVPVIDLCHNVPHFSIKAGAYLLASLVEKIPDSAVCLGVVDPGVGGPRDAIILGADGRWFVGPDNGLFAIVMRRANEYEVHRIDWRPAVLSDSFHGRDLLAPTAAMLALESFPESTPDHVPVDTSDWLDDLAQVIYIDHFGNAITGLRSTMVESGTVLDISNKRIHHARTFSEAVPGLPFWYVNSSGLVEVAINQDSAARILGLRLGDDIHIL